ncbi:MAG: aspartyl-phosphate phosphatase Spo0E family protein [Clostridia bacterium]
MVDEKICKLREELNDSIINGNDYSITYRISVELDELIAQYYGTREKKQESKVEVFNEI